jgi:hypothetical protein
MYFLRAAAPLICVTAIRPGPGAAQFENFFKPEPGNRLVGEFADHRTALLTFFPIAVQE